MVIDRELYAWDIDSDGKVTPRGALTGGDEPATIVRRTVEPDQA